MIGQTISHYNILQKLGEGGMGKVYLAEDTKLNRTVALKFLPSELIRDEQTRHRFLHEAQATSALDHPNIGAIYEINESDENPFIAMAYYAGGTLREKIAQNDLTITQVVNIACCIARGLQKSHSKDIVHRDIKPANILFSEDGEPKIIDFGLAKFTGKTVLTRTGTIVGTIAYMSPEQTQGTKIDQRTDIWALGVILYEMLAGERPFKGEYERNFTDILSLQGDVAREIAEQIKVKLTPGEETYLTKQRTVNPEAYKAYLKGNFYLYKLTRRAMETALQYFKLAAELDPINPLYRWLYAMDLNYLHRYDEAVRELRKTLESSPDNPGALSTLRTTYHMKEMYKESIDIWHRSYTADNDQQSLAALDSGYEAGGYHMALRRVAESKIRQSKAKFITPWQIATLYTRAGMVDEALQWFEKSLIARDPNMPYLNVDPIFDYLRNDPRFKNLIRKIGL